MLKKRNIAMVMAAATVATSVAPVFAAVETQTVDETTLLSEVKKVIDVEYYGTITEEKVYSVSATLDGTTSTVNKIGELEILISKAKLQEKDLTVKITDKGHAVVNGRIVKNVDNSTYKVYLDAVASAGTTDTLHDEISKLDLPEVIKTRTYNDYKGDVAGTPAQATNAEITLASGKTIELNVADKQLDFSKGLDKNGNKIVVSKGMDAKVAKEVVAFEEKKLTVQVDIDANDIDMTKATKIVSEFTFKASAANQNVVLNYTDLKTTRGYTTKGAEFVNMLIKANANDVATDTTEIISGGKTYTIVFNSANITGPTLNKDGKYEVVAKINVNEKGAAASKAKDVEISVVGDAQKDLVALKNDMLIADKANLVTPATDGIKTLAGANRFETAVEVSKESFKTNDTASSIVLVGEEAIVDGLAAAPLATAKNAPILLTKKDSIDSNTLTEMKRALPADGKEQTIYIVGGENVISKAVESQLVKELNANIVRLSGKTRTETSVEIAKELKKGSNVNANAYVVGAFGEADAMSIAAIAAKDTEAGTPVKVSPILVSPEAGLTKEVKDFLYDNKAVVTNIDVIGGTSKVSRNVIKDIEDNSADASIKRVAGLNRSETNAMVIEEYTSNLRNIVVAKDGQSEGNAKLIDALTVAPLAAKSNAPIVLATNQLSDSQEYAVSAKLDKNATVPQKSIVQTGHGVASTVISKLAQILGL